MSSLLYKADNEDWTGIQQGKVHAATNRDATWNTGSHHTIWGSKTVDSKLIDKDVMVFGMVTMIDFSESGSFCAGVKATTGFITQVQTYYSNREWTGGTDIPGGNKRTGIFPFQLLGRLTSNVITIQVRVDMGSSGTIRFWDYGDNQANIFVCPVHTP
jgi:hypothetical protein